MRLAQHESTALFFGDAVVFYGALWLTLFVRYGVVPDAEQWYGHALPFTALFLLSVIIYFIAGLYDSHTLFLRERVSVLVSVSQASTAVAGALLFFLVPYFGITPKTNLLIFLVLSSLLGIGWRLIWAHVPRGRRKTRVLLLGGGREAEELIHELQENPRYGVGEVEHIAPSEVVVSSELEAQLHAYIRKRDITVIIADMRHPAMKDITPTLYRLLFIHPTLSVLDILSLYERIFRRIPVSLLEEGWFVAHGGNEGGKKLYHFLHRMFDMGMGVCTALACLFFLPWIRLFTWWEDRGPLFIKQERVGERGTAITMYKFRSMSGVDTGDEVLRSERVVTRVGAFLRATRIDELPQCLNLLRGTMSFIGPRPELPALAEVYAREIPYYQARHLVRPGLTGWAQLYHDAHPHHGTDVAETRNKLSYDLYYLKHRSLFLDIEIAIKTIKKILTRSGA
jgi:lipopolysaccharide/colanic/teichoic acid biosynthesis glycosyltransferase